MSNMRIIIFLSLIIALPAYGQQTQWQRELVYRTAHGNAEDVALLVNRLQSPNLTDEFGQPLLFIAATRTDSDATNIVKALIDAGADVNFAGDGNHYAMIAATQADNIEAVRLLLQSGADHYVKDSNGTSLREYALISSSPAITQLIDKRFQRDADMIARYKSQAGFKQMRYDAFFHGCALQYYSYYYASGQDDVSQTTQQTTLAKHKQAISKAQNLLVQYHAVKPTQAQALYKLGASAIYQELEAMVSNRWRREQGIGADEDMQQRCNKIAKNTL